MSGSLSFVRRISQIGTRLWLALFAEKVGADAFGNVYYKAKKPGDKTERRFVFYKGAPDASSVPPCWFSWLHHTTQQPIGLDSPYRQSWEKEYQPNPTGTEAAWLPRPLALRRGDARDESKRIWAPWAEVTRRR